jgi:hypothetical protein
MAYGAGTLISVPACLFQATRFQPSRFRNNVELPAFAIFTRISLRPARRRNRIRRSEV